MQSVRLREKTPAPQRHQWCALRPAPAPAGWRIREQGPDEVDVGKKASRPPEKEAVKNIWGRKASIFRFLRLQKAGAPRDNTPVPCLPEMCYNNYMSVEERMRAQDDDRERLLRRMEVAEGSRSGQEVKDALAEAKRRLRNNYAGDNPVRKAQARLLLWGLPPEH